MWYKCNGVAYRTMGETFSKPQAAGVERVATDSLDTAGATASFLCAIHCALMPLVITLLPLIGLAFLADHRVEWALFGLSAIVGVSSLCFGYREHRSRRALAILAVGLA